jgi:hypothetical protein
MAPWTTRVCRRGRDAFSAGGRPMTPTSGNARGPARSAAGARSWSAPAARPNGRTGWTSWTAVRAAGARGSPPPLARSCAGRADTSRRRPEPRAASRTPAPDPSPRAPLRLTDPDQLGALSSAVERRPYKAEVGGSTPPAPTKRIACSVARFDRAWPLIRELGPPWIHGLALAQFPRSETLVRLSIMTGPREPIRRCSPAGRVAER